MTLDWNLSSLTGITPSSMEEHRRYSKLSAENEKIVRKLKKLKKRNGELELELRDINEKLSREKLLRDHIQHRSVGVQTDPPGYRPYVRHLQPSTKTNKQDKAEEQKKEDRLLSMHNKLMKRYEKELKANTAHTETIAALNLRIQELERQLYQSREQVHRLERAATPAGRRRHARSRSRSTSPFTNSQAQSSEFQRLKKERDQLARDKKKLKKELQGLDEGFFEEIEDLKYALQQSAKLNREYEKALRRTCNQFGVPYPMADVTATTSQAR